MIMATGSSTRVNGAQRLIQAHEYDKDCFLASLLENKGFGIFGMFSACSREVRFATLGSWSATVV